MDQIRYAKEIGVKIALGTDSGSLGVDPGKSMAQEIAVLLESGFSVREAIHCATEAGAGLLGLENLGVLAPGKEATFWVVAGGPHELPGNLSRIVELFVRGKGSVRLRLLLEPGIELPEALRADAVAEREFGMRLQVAFDLIPVPLVVPDLLAGGADGEQSL